MSRVITVDQLREHATRCTEVRRLVHAEPEYESAAMGAVEAAVDLIDPAYVFGMMSGGRDSQCAAHIASRHPRFGGIVHINTGVGIEATRQYVRGFCADRSWPLYEEVAPPCRWAPDIPAYDALVLKFGFPGPAQHMLMYNRLKERALSKFSAKMKRPRGKKILFVSGVRRHESQRRMRQANQFAFEKSWAWCSAIFDWSDDDKWDYINRNRFQANEVTDNLCMSGECLCGAFAKEGELDLIEALYPHDAERIRDLERRAREAGVKLHKWGQTKKTLQELKKVKTQGGAMCTSCVAAVEEEAERDRTL